MQIQSVEVRLTKSQREELVELLDCCLANSYVLLVKTEQCHQDIVRLRLQRLCELWEAHYDALSENIDAIAGRIRALGESPNEYPIAMLPGFWEKTLPTGSPVELASVRATIQNLIQDYEQVIRDLLSNVDRAISEYRDRETADMLMGMVIQYADMAWELCSFPAVGTLQKMHYHWSLRVSVYRSLHDFGMPISRDR